MGRVGQKRDRMRRDAVKDLDADESEIQKCRYGKRTAETLRRVTMAQAYMVVMVMVVTRNVIVRV